MPDNTPPQQVAAPDHAGRRADSVQWLLDVDPGYLREIGPRETTGQSRRVRPRQRVVLLAGGIVVIGAVAVLALPRLASALFDAAPAPSPVSLKNLPAVVTVGPVGAPYQAKALSRAAPPVLTVGPVAAPSRAQAMVVHARPPTALPAKHPASVAERTPPHPRTVGPPETTTVTMLAAPASAPPQTPEQTPKPPANILAKPVVKPVALAPKVPPAPVAPVAVPHAIPAAPVAPKPAPAKAETPTLTIVPPPAGPHFNVALSFTADETARAAAFARALRQQGFTVRSIVIPPTIGRWPGVAFFFDRDRAKALLIARQLTALTGTHQHARLSDRHPYPGPGTVEVSLLDNRKPKTRGPAKTHAAHRRP
jgi:hypothetical protein